MKETLNPMDAEERTIAPCPSSEELRMVRSIASSAVSEAMMRGESHCSFRGFRINTVRLSREYDKRIAVRVELVVSLDGHMIDRENVDMFALHVFDTDAH